MRFNDLKHQQKELIAGRFDNPNYTPEDKVRLIIQIESELEAKNRIIQLSMFKWDEMNIISIYFQIKQFIKCLIFRCFSREKQIRTLKFHHQQIKEINGKANICLN